MTAVQSDGHFNSTTDAVSMQTVILVAPGTYREMVNESYASGTSAFPLIFEGVPDSSGNMPTISAATAFANNSWTVVSETFTVPVSRTIPATGGGRRSR